MFVKSIFACILQTAKNIQNNKSDIKPVESGSLGSKFTQTCSVHLLCQLVRKFLYDSPSQL